MYGYKAVELFCYEYYTYTKYSKYKTDKVSARSDLRPVDWILVHTDGVANEVRPERFGGRSGARLVHSRDAELVLEAGLEVAHDRARLLDRERRGLLPRAARLAAALQSLLDHVALDRRAAVVLRWLPRQIHRVPVELDDLEALRRVRRV